MIVDIEMRPIAIVFVTQIKAAWQLIIFTSNKYTQWTKFLIEEKWRSIPLLFDLRWIVTHTQTPTFERRFTLGLMPIHPIFLPRGKSLWTTLQTSWSLTNTHLYLLCSLLIETFDCARGNCSGTILRCYTFLLRSNLIDVISQKWKTQIRLHCECCKK